MITIKSKKEGFRRLGIAHPAAETHYLDSRFTDAELAILKADPMLTVTIAPDVPGEPGPKSECLQETGTTAEKPQPAAAAKAKAKGKK